MLKKTVDHDNDRAKINIKKNYKPSEWPVTENEKYTRFT